LGGFLELKRVVHVYQTTFERVRGGIQGHIHNLIEAQGRDITSQLSSEDVAAWSISGQYFIKPHEIREIWRYLESADVIHFHGLANIFTIAVLACATKSRTKKNLVFTPHAHLATTHRKVILYKIFLRVFAIRLINQCDKVIALTFAEREMLVSHGVSRNRIEVIPNGHSVTCAAPINFDDREYDLCFVGRDVPNKNLDFLFEVYEKYLRDRRFLAISKLKRQSIPSGVVVESDLNNAELYSRVGSSRVLVMPSTYEAFGIVALEALACGTPVVISDMCMIKEYIEGKIFCKVYKSGCEKSMANAIEGFLDLDADDARYIGNEAMKFAEENTWGEISKRVSGEAYGV
jgi:glycosyltransferase involved in cell wall biosynthesis